MEDHISWAKSNSRQLSTPDIKDAIVKETEAKLAADLNVARKSDVFVSRWSR